MPTNVCVSIKMGISASGRPLRKRSLDVAGEIMAQDIVVSANALPDYVFEPGYRNAPLPEVAAYIEENHHLPGMPSAEDAAKNGLSVGDMQKKLLEKVEELTLHMIAADERNRQLEQQNRDLRDRVQKLENHTAVGDSAIRGR